MKISDIEYFAQENCASFAYALWLAHGKRGSFVVLSDPNGEPWDDNFDEEFTHVIYSDDKGQWWDVRGAQTLEQIKNHYHVYVSGEYEPEYFWRYAVGMTDDKPLYGDEQTIAEAMALIRSQPDMYGLS